MISTILDIYFLIVGTIIFQAEEAVPDLASHLPLDNLQAVLDERPPEGIPGAPAAPSQTEKNVTYAYNSSHER